MINIDMKKGIFEFGGEYAEILAEIAVLLRTLRDEIGDDKRADELFSLIIERSKISHEKAAYDFLKDPKKVSDAFFDNLKKGNFIIASALAKAMADDVKNDNRNKGD